MRILFKYTTFVIFLVYGFELCAQISQTHRIELELDKSYTSQKAHLFGSDGLVLVSKRYLTAPDEIRLKFDVYDTTLQKKTERELALEYFKGYNLTYSNEKYIWVIFHSVKKGNFVLIKYEPATDKVQKFAGATIPKFDIDYFKVLGDICVFGGTYKKKPFLSVYNTVSKNMTYHDLEPLSKNASINSINFSKNNEYVNVVLRECYGRDGCSFITMILDKNGKNLTKLVPVPDAPGKRFTSCNTSIMRNGNYLAYGTYSRDNRKLSQGIFIQKFNTNETVFTQFYNFLDIKNFLDYLPENKQNRIQNKQERRRLQGRELELDYRMLMHEIIETDSQKILVGEAYYPTYRTETYSTIGPNGNTIMRSRQVFDGFQFSHAIIAAFNDQGTMLWSNSFEMWLTYKPYTLFKNVTLSVMEGEVSMLFANGSQFKSISFRNGETTNDRSIDVLESASEGDRVKWSTNTKIEYWYDNYFLASGHRRIVGKKGNKGSKRRTVLFLNKIKY